MPPLGFPYHFPEPVDVGFVMLQVRFGDWQAVSNLIGVFVLILDVPEVFLPGSLVAWRVDFDDAVYKTRVDLYPVDIGVIEARYPCSKGSSRHDARLYYKQSVLQRDNGLCPARHVKRDETELNSLVLCYVLVHERL